MKQFIIPDFGTITSGIEHFFPWKTQWPDDDKAAEGMNPQQQLIRGMLNKTNLLHILRTCSVFMDTDSGARIKVVRRYQQLRAAGRICHRLRYGRTQTEKSGVVWHTQGSGKSLTMVFTARMMRASGVALGKVGISVTPFVAAIGALGLGAGLAVQGFLSNYGAGLNIILARPFVVGDTIRIKGVVGLVKEVHLAATVLVDEDDVRITIPNKHIIGEIIHNSSSDTLAEETVGISYGSDPEKAITVIRKAIEETEDVTTERPPQVGIEDFADSSINIGIRFWAPTHCYFDTRYRVNAAIFNALKANDIEIPFPQREVRILGDGS